MSQVNVEAPSDVSDEDESQNGGDEMDFDSLSPLKSDAAKFQGIAGGNQSARLSPQVRGQ